MRDAGVTPEIRVHNDPDAVAAAAARAIARTAAGAVRRRDRFTLVLSGGETPLATYRLLAARRDVDWARADVFFGDERAVPPDDAASNYHAAQETLLAHAARAGARIHRMHAEAGDLDAAAAAYESKLRAVLGKRPHFDIVLLGLGADGHVASLFPAHAALVERRLWVVATPAPHIAPRLTLTFPAFAAARHVFFLVVGAGKSTMLRRVLDGARDIMLLPAQGIAPRRGRVVWFVDRAAWPT